MSKLARVVGSLILSFHFSAEQDSKSPTMRAALDDVSSSLASFLVEDRFVATILYMTTGQRCQCILQWNRNVGLWLMSRHSIWLLVFVYKSILASSFIVFKKNLLTTIHCSFAFAKSMTSRSTDVGMTTSPTVLGPGSVSTHEMSSQ